MMSDCAFIKLDSIIDLEKAAQLEMEFERLALSGKKEIYLDFSFLQI